jgi:putative membrane protein
MLLLQFGVCLSLLIVGLLVYMARDAVSRTGAAAAAAATVLGGALFALAIPLTALLATTAALLDLVVWGLVAVILQLVTVIVVSLLLRGVRGMIEAGQVAAAIPLVAAQLADRAVECGRDGPSLKAAINQGDGHARVPQEFRRRQGG